MHMLCCSRTDYIEIQYKILFEKINFAQVRWLGWLECHPIHQKSVGSIHAWVVGFIPSWSTYRRQPTDVSLSHPCVSLSLSLSLSLSPYLPSFLSKINKHSLGWGFKKINFTRLQVLLKAATLLTPGYTIHIIFDMYPFYYKFINSAFIK